VFICLEQRLVPEDFVYVDSDDDDDDDDLNSSGNHRGLLDILIFLIRI